MDIEMNHLVDADTREQALRYHKEAPQDGQRKKKRAEPTNATASQQISFLHECIFVATICMAQLTTQIGFGQSVSILQVIGDGFGIEDPASLSWFSSGYSLTVGTFILLAGRVGDLFGHKKVFILSTLWFALWSTVAGLAVYSNQILFVWARVLQGIGPAGMLPNGLALMGIYYAAGPRKNMAFALFGACAPSGGVIGNASAALFALKWWPWAFWSSGLALLALAMLSIIAIPSPPPSPDQSKSLREKIILLDIPGGSAGMISLVLMCFVWNQAPIDGWDKNYIDVCLVVSIAFAVVFFMIEHKYAKSPLVPFSTFSGDVGFVVGCIACGWGCFGIWYFYLFQILANLRGASPLLASAYLSPAVVSGAVASISTGFLLSHARPAWIISFSLLCFGTATTLVATLPPHQIYWGQIFVSAIVAPWGMDTSFPAATVMFSNMVSKEHQGMTASLITAIVNYSISLGLGFAATVEVHVNDGGKSPADVLHGYRGALYMGIGLAGLGIILSVIFIVKEILTCSITVARRRRQSMALLEG